MQNTKAHIIIIDGAKSSGKKMFALELALVLLYNNQKTALLLSPDSPLKTTLDKRKEKYPYLPTPDILFREDFFPKADSYNAIIIPASADSDIKLAAKTYITLLPDQKQILYKFQNNKAYINDIWELKKKIAATFNRSLDWVICQNSTKNKIIEEPAPELIKIARLYGFRPTPPLNRRKPYKNNVFGLSAQDKITPELKKTLTYEDICAKREIFKVAEFIFS